MNSQEMNQLLNDVRALALQAAKGELVQIPHVTDKAVFMLLPNPDGSLHLEDMGPYMPGCPSRVVSSRVLLDLGSFIEYLRQYALPQTRVFAQLEKEPMQFVAVIDWHRSLVDCADEDGLSIDGQAGWCQHTVTLEIRKSQQLLSWQRLDGKMMAQADFCEFLKDNRLDVVKPCNAELLGLVMNLEMTAERRCMGKVATNAGQALRFEEDVRAQVGGQVIQLPSEISLALPLFVGGKPVELTADFKVRMDSGKLAFGYRLLGMDRAVRDAVQSMRADIEAVRPVFV